jgi:uncharacterized UPF0160 family protein
MKEIKKIITHSKNFHTDEVVAVALASICFPRAEIIRTRNEKDLQIYNEDSSCLVIDVGCNYNPQLSNFDTHQTGFSKARENKIKFASIGIFWEVYGSEVIKTIVQERNLRMSQQELGEIADILDGGFIVSLDAADSFQIENFFVPLRVEERLDIWSVTLFSIINDFRPLYILGEEHFDEKFHEVLQIVKPILRRKMIKYVDTYLARGEARKVLQEAERYGEKTLLISKRIQWSLVVEEFPEIEFLIDFGNSEGVYSITALRDTTGNFRNGHGLLPSKRHLEDIELQQEDGFKNLCFVHKDGFMAKTLDLATALFVVQESI